jgi:hypothetical protein
MFTLRDEERNYRDIIDLEPLQNNQRIEVDLLRTIVKVIEAVLK